MKHISQVMEESLVELIVSYTRLLRDTKSEEEYKNVMDNINRLHGFLIEMKMRSICLK